MLALKLVGGLDTLPCRRELDQYTRLVNALGFVQLYQCQHGRYFFGLQRVPHTSIRCRALSTEAFLSKENLASTSVETLPGTMLRISLPNCTRRLSNVASTCSSMLLPCFFPYATASSMSFAYSGFLDAARINEGLVVAS